MKVNIVAYFTLALSITCNTVLASDKSKPNLKDSDCTYGSHKELYTSFAEKNYIVVAQGKRIHDDGKIKDFADILFLISPDMEYFHSVSLNGVKHDHFKACVINSAREVDYQFAPPTPNLLPRKNREHMIFLSDNSPKNISCPDNNQQCLPWLEWSQNFKQTTLLSAYSYSTSRENDPYNEIVELRLDNKIIRPTRGALSEHARTKYALRLRNTLNESIEDAKNAKIAYKQIHKEADHKLPLIFLNLSESRNWSIDEINREEGLVKTMLNGVEFELYPMSNNAYKYFESIID